MGTYRLNFVSKWVARFYSYSLQQYFDTTYERWELESPEGKMLDCWDITAHSYLSELLHALAEGDSIKVPEEHVPYFKTMFRHSRLWQLYSRALEILATEGKEKALEFLFEKLSVRCLSDKLTGEKT